MATKPAAPSLLTATAPLAVVVGGLAASLLWLHLPYWVPLALGLAAAWLLGAADKKLTHRQLARAAWGGVKTTGLVTVILLLVGALIAVWMASGTVPSLIYYGLLALRPGWFLPLAFLLTAAMSMVLGSCVGTLSTLGVALMGTGTALGLPAPLVAGALLSGAVVGDRASPVSATVHLTAAMVGSPHEENRRWLRTTAAYALPLAAALYALAGWQALPVAGTMSAGPNRLLEALPRHIVISPLAALPPLVVIALAVAKVPIRRGLLAGIGAGAALALWQQGLAAGDLVTAVLEGYWAQTGVPELDRIIHGGGILPLVNLVLLIPTAGAFNGVMEATGFMTRVVTGLVNGAASTGALVLRTGLISVGMAALACNQALSVIVPARMLAPVYKERGLPPALLARTLADSGTVLSPLIPWNLFATLSATALGVPTASYAPWAWFPLLLPVFTLLFGYRYRVQATTSPTSK